MKLNEYNFNLILNGKKTAEVRLLDNKRKKVKIGDEIVFIYIEDMNQKIYVTVTDIIYTSSFKEVPIKIGFGRLGFMSHNTKEYVEYMYNFYSPQQERELGVVVLCFIKSSK